MSSRIRAATRRSVPLARAGSRPAACLTSSRAVLVSHSYRSSSLLLVSGPVSARCSRRTAAATAGSSSTGDRNSGSGLPVSEVRNSGQMCTIREDGSGNTYLELFRQPVVVYEATAEILTQAHLRALTRPLPLAIYTMDMFTTGNDDDNRAVVRAVPADALSFAGLAVHGPRNAVDKVFKGATLHP